MADCQIKVLAIFAFCFLGPVVAQYGRTASQPYGPKLLKVVPSTYSAPQIGKEAYQKEIYIKPFPYKFGYDVKDEYGNTHFRNEDGDEHGNKKGSYGYTDAYGVYRQVEYVADGHGFQAYIKTNEPGTMNKNPAAVQIVAAESPVKYTKPAVQHVGYKPSAIAPGPFAASGFSPFVKLTDYKAYDKSPKMVHGEY